MNLDLPPSWRSGFRLTAQTNGKSGAAVYRTDNGRFIKSEPAGPLAELPGEIARLDWLHGTGLPCPAVLDTAEYAGRHWLMMTAIPGRDLAQSPDIPAETAVTLVAGALRDLHALDIADCPFDHRVAVRVATATARFAAGLFDGDNPADGPAHHAQLLANRPATEDLVVTHGDACFPNFMAEDRRFTGFIDCGRLGVADRCQDLALACRSLGRNFGPAAMETFLAAYGVTDPDQAKLGWYNLLDEFF